ncbi:hypothetical protein [uncultured Victivallis sp.]|uniref:hypothetical protein n=1 Tax=uncultured Victivallis sp. TaxID=354118 RepID=UPI0025D6E1DD|nr:hypothetical protein [uncultured Victivallis sp.]
MSEIIVLDAIPFQFDSGELSAKLHLTEDDAEISRAWKNLIDNVTALARPKALFRECSVDAVTEDTVVAEGVPLKSRVMVRQLGERRRLFVYCATCGTETAVLEESLDPLERFWLEELRLALLRRALAYLRGEISRRYRIPKLAGMAPGSGDADVWPLEEQIPLFERLLEGRVTESIGVELTDSLLMVPCKSSSGVLFAAEHDFTTCQLCHRKNCPDRRSPRRSPLLQASSTTPTKMV